MGYFSGQQQQKTVELDVENTVTVRRLTFGESQAVLSESTVFDLVTQQGRLDFGQESNRQAIQGNRLLVWPWFRGASRHGRKHRFPSSRGGRFDREGCRINQRWADRGGTKKLARAYERMIMQSIPVPVEGRYGMAIEMMRWMGWDWRLDRCTIRPCGRNRLPHVSR